MTDLSKQLLAWYDQYGRTDLPWQQKKNAYRVWVSEVMLQQTQVTTVIPYFLRFMQRFPTINDLAKAEQDDVLHLWSGLGYYARARNLHRCAQVVVNGHDGEFPEDLDTLQGLPGIGRSTAGAIMALAQNQRASILDGNVKRVLSRVFAVEGWPGKTAVSAQLWELTEKLTPKTRVADYTQAIMDLGATLCTRSSPQCDACPWQTPCLAHKTGQPQQYPHKKPKKILPIKSTIMLLLQDSEQRIFLYRRPSQGVWGGLWSLPEFADETELDASITIVQRWDVMRHTFSHFHLDITPIVATTSAQDDGVYSGQNKQWIALDDIKVGLAAPVQALLQRLR